MQIRAAIEVLPEKLRVVFELRELDGFSTQETAEALGLSVEYVKTRLHRARQWLRQRLTDYFMK